MQSQTSCGRSARCPWPARRRARRFAVALILGGPVLPLLTGLVAARATAPADATPARPSEPPAATTASPFDADGRVVAFWNVATERREGFGLGAEFVRPGRSPVATGPAHAAREGRNGESGLE